MVVLYGGFVEVYTDLLELVCESNKTCEQVRTHVNCAGVSSYEEFPA